MTAEIAFYALLCLVILGFILVELFSGKLFFSKKEYERRAIEAQKKGGIFLPERWEFDRYHDGNILERCWQHIGVIAPITGVVGIFYFFTHIH